MIILEFELPHRTKKGSSHKKPPRYKIGEIQRALSLKQRDPGAYRRLRKELRDSVDGYVLWTMSVAENQKVISAAIESSPREVKKLLRESSSHPNSEWPQLPFDELLE